MRNPLRFQFCQCVERLCLPVNLILTLLLGFGQALFLATFFAKSHSYRRDQSSELILFHQTQLFFTRIVELEALATTPSITR
jgi:hypothetical protein